MESIYKALKPKAKTAKSKKTAEKKTKNRRYTNADRVKAVTGWKKSGLPLRVYARKIKIPRETLRCWVIGKYKVSPKVKIDARKKAKDSKR